MQRRTRGEARRASGKKRALWIGLIALALAAAMLLAYVFVYVPYRERRRYPLRFVEQIEAAAREFDIDPYLLMALAHKESGLRAEVVSSAGAVGLTQVVPDTGAWIAESYNLDMPDFDPEMLKDPAINARLGAWYLRFLLNRYDGREYEALTAYNQGQGRVDKWLADPAISKDGKGLQKSEDGMEIVGLPENIVDGKYYAGLVFKARSAYIKWYPKAFEGEG